MGSWPSHRENNPLLSTTETEFVAASSCACQSVWMRRILEELGHVQVGSTVINCDNNSTIKFSKNLVMYGRSKHIDVQFHFLRDLTKYGIVELIHYGMQDQIANLMTKPLRLKDFQRFREKLGVCSISDVN